MNEDMRRIILCEKMGWDFYTYESQPTHFIDGLWTMVQKQAEVANRKGWAIQ